MIVSHIEEDMRVIERWQCADAHEALCTDFNHGDAHIIVEVGDRPVYHMSPLLVKGESHYLSELGADHSGQAMQFLGRAALFPFGRRNRREAIAQDDRPVADDGKGNRVLAAAPPRLPRRRARGKTAFAVLVAATLAAAVVLIGPRGFDAGFMLVHQDDPVALADRLVAKRLDATVARREIETALAIDDPELAASFVELASGQGIALDPALVERVAAANSAPALAKRAAGSFAHGLVSGEPQTAAGFAGTTVGDLFVFGDVRDAVREGSRFASGEKADQFILGLACVGLVVTAGTYATLGAATPVRAGMSLVKGAYKTGRIGGRLAASIGRSLRATVDLAALRKAISSISLLRPGAALRSMRASVRLDRARGLLRLMGDTGRVQAKAGTRAAMDGLRIAQGPKDMARVARLAEAKGSKTRAILKLGGRAAVALTVASFKLASWLFSAVMMLFGFCSALKGLTERVTHRWFVWGRARRLRRLRRVPRVALA